MNSDSLASNISFRFRHDLEVIIVLEVKGIALESYVYGVLWGLRKERQNIQGEMTFEPDFKEQTGL